MAAALMVLLWALSSIVPVYGSDMKWYVAMAENRFNEVIQPFSGRFLQPFLTGQISSYFGLSVNQSFFVVTIISLISFFIINAVLFKKISQPSLFLVPIFLLPYFAGLFQASFLPDSFYIFLIAFFFLFLMERMEAAGLLILFLLFLTRESTILLGIALLVVSFLRSQKILTVAVLVVIALSIFTTYQIAALGLPNIHNLSNFSYLVLKMPYNFFNNVFGAKLWINTLPNLCNPLFVFNVPRYLQIGPIDSVGFCRFDASAPLYTAMVLLTTFGVMPLALCYVLFSRFKLVMNKSPLWLLIALTYGLASYFMSVLVTGAVQRSVGYGWPAFLLAVPFLLTAFFQIDKKFLLKLSFVQMFVVWLPIVVGKGTVFGVSVLWFVFLLILAAYVYTFHLLVAQKKNPI